MPSKRVGWATHGAAVNARDDTAERMAKVIKSLNELRDLVQDRDYCDLDVLVTVGYVKDVAYAVLIDMHKQGAEVVLPPLD